MSLCKRGLIRACMSAESEYVPGLIRRLRQTRQTARARPVRT